MRGAIEAAGPAAISSGDPCVALRQPEAIIGTDHTGSSQTYYKTIAAIWGAGYVPGRDTASGPVTQA